MTTSRIVRGTKARIFLYICGILFITGIIACYNNTLSQLDDARKSSEICHQQEENLSTQLQVISDYKQKLEKSLKTEKAEHQHMKNDLDNIINEEKSKREKSLNDANLRFSSLQQHFNLLKTEYDDFKEDSSTVLKKHLSEINDLKSKLKELQEELKKVESSKENLKTQYLQVEVDKENLQKQLEHNVDSKANHESEVNHLTKINHELQSELSELKAKSSFNEAIQPPTIHENSVGNNFDGQLQVAPDEFAIQKKKTDEPKYSQVSSIESNIKLPTKSTTASSSRVSLGQLNGARPLLVPTVTPATANKNRASSEQANKQPETFVLPLPYNRNEIYGNSNKGNMKIQLPNGVVPVPEKRDLEKKTDDDKNELPVNSRYKNKVDASVKDENKKFEDADKENVANEVFDQPHNNGAYDALGFGELNNNDPIKSVDKHNFKKQHIDNLGVDTKEKKNYENDYKDNQNDMQLEENDPEDDDPEDYGDHMGRIKDPVVRN